ncbi:MAG TPA: hypothetical protein VNR36_13780 [Pseudolysinimonas sp.]|nr:hypothetical protein [Pseudolysinimonas sp.]
MSAVSRIAVAGRAWRNRPIAALESAAREGVRPAVVLALEPDDLQGWITALWPAAEVRDATEYLPGMRRAAAGVEPAGGEPPVRPDLALLHYPFADEDGALYSRGDVRDDEVDRLIVRAAARVVVTVDEVLTRAQGRRAVASKRWDAGEIADVRHVPFGAFPASSDGLYRADASARDALTTWAAVARSNGSDRLQALTTATRLAGVSLPHGLEWPGR